VVKNRIGQVKILLYAESGCEKLMDFIGQILITRS